MSRSQSIEDKHNIRNGIIATVFGGLILALILWFIGYVPQVGKTIKSAVGQLVPVIFGNVSTPVPVLLLLAVLSLPSIVRILRMFKKKPSAVRPSPLSDLEMEVLRILAEEGSALRFGDLTERTGENKLRVDQALDKLQRVGLINVELNYLYGPSYYLSPKGRDYAISKGMA